MTAASEERGKKKMGMEIIVSKEALNGIENYDELMTYVKEQISPYEGLVVTDDVLGKAKSVVANMRKAAKAASDLRIRIEKENKERIEKTVEQLKELTRTYQDAAGKIDEQVKTITDGRKKAKWEALKSYWNARAGEAGIADFVPFEAIADQKWTNATVTEESAHEDMDDMLERYTQDIEIVKNMTDDDRLRNSLMVMYKIKRNLTDVMNYKK